MKHIIAFIITLSMAAPAFASMRCGIPPIPPIGCSRDQSVCYCDEYGQCQWVFACR